MPATITATGTWTVPASLGKPVGGSGVEFDTIPPGAFDSRASLQRGTNLFDELNQFITLMGAAFSVSGTVIIDQLLVMLRDLRRTPNMGERVYAP